MLSLIIVIILIVATAVFSAQNAAPITVSFLSWKFDASLAIVIFLSFLAGMIAGMIRLSLGRSSTKEKRGADPSIEERKLR